MPAEDRSSLQSESTELTQLRTRLASTSAVIDALAYTVSHDLKAPLTTILGYGELLATWEDPDPAQRKEVTKQLLTAARRLAKMIDVLHDYSRLGQSELQIESIAPPDLIRSVWRTVAREQNLVPAALQLDDSLPQLRGDRTLLERLFRILLDNAARYRDSDRAPRIRVTGKVRQGQVRIALADNGIGIERRHADKLFALFQRLPAAQPYAGDGNGLAFAQRIVQLHGGTLDYTSEVGQGTTFFVTLPAKPPASP